MKSTLWLSIIIAGFFAAAEPVQAFDPGAWLKKGIIELDKRAAEDMARRGKWPGRSFHPAKTIKIPSAG